MKKIAEIIDEKTIQVMIARCPDLAPLIDMARRFEAQEEARRVDLVACLSVSQDVFDLTALQSKPLDELEKIAALVSIDVPKVNYSYRGLTQEPRVMGDDSIKELPDPWDLTSRGIKLN